MQCSFAAFANSPVLGRPDIGHSPQSQRTVCRRICHSELVGWQVSHRQTSGRCPVWEGQQLLRPSISRSACASSRRQLVLSTSSALSETKFVTEDEFNEQISSSPVVVVDWMAKWCRKCIYLKPKLEKMLREDFPGVPLIFVDVNSVPGGLVYGQGIQKMPTIAVYQDGKKVKQHIAAETGSSSVEKIRLMIQNQVDSNKPKTGPFAWVQDAFRSQDPAP